MSHEIQTLIHTQGQVQLFSVNYNKIIPFYDKSVSLKK